MTEFQAPICVGPDDAPDKYRLVREVGHGGEAELWYAEMDVAGGAEPVAVKILRADRMAEFEQVRVRWSEQAELLRFIARPGVVTVREHFEGQQMHRAGDAGIGRALYLVMNWVEGANLRDWVPLHSDMAGVIDGLRYMSQVATVLDWLHSGAATPSNRPVIHGDVSPANIVLTPAGQAVLVDFGLVRMAAHQTTQPFLSPGYAAPEVWRGEYSAAADRYAFGAVTYFVLTGAEPPTQREEIRAGLEALPLVAALGAQIIDPLMAMFDGDPTKRPPAVDWIRLLRAGSVTSTTAAATRRGAGGAHAIPAPAASPAHGRRKGLLITAAALAVLLAAGGIAFAAAGAGHKTKNAAASQPATPPIASSTPSSSATTASSPAPSSLVPSSPATSTPASIAASPSPSDTSSASPSVSTRAAGPPSETTSPLPFGSAVANGPAYLTDYQPTEQDSSGGDHENTVATASNGVTYGHPILLYSQGPNNRDGGTFWVDYNIGRLWRTLTTTVGLDDAAATNASDTFRILVDGKVVATGSVRLGMSVPVKLDVTNGLRLRLEITTLYTNYQESTNTVVFGDPQMYS